MLVVLITSADRTWLCRHRTGRAAAVRGPEPAPRAPPGAHTKAASSSGKTNTNSDGQPPQLLPTCHSCGEEVVDAERYAPLPVCHSLIYDCMLSQLWLYAVTCLRKAKHAAAMEVVLKAVLAFADCRAQPPCVLVVSSQETPGGQIVPTLQIPRRVSPAARTSPLLCQAVP